MLHLLKRSQQRLLSLLRSDLEFNEDDFSGCYELNIHRAYSRPRLVTNIVDDDDDEELSDYVKDRLFIARTLALKAYQNKWG